MKLQELVQSLDLGEVVLFQNLAWMPLFGEDKVKEDLLTLDEAFEMDKGSSQARLLVTESDIVQHLLVENRFDRKLFVPCGMIFEGESQNRASQYPTIIPAHSKTIKYPVHCAEQGQPLLHGTTYHSSSTIIQASARSGGVDQGRTWSSIASSQTSYRTQSRTHSYVDVVKGVDLSDYITAMGDSKPGQQGYIAAVRSNGDIYFYADVLGSNALLGKLYHKLCQSIAAVAKQLHTSDLKIRKDSFATFLSEAGSVDMVEADMEGQELGTILVANTPVVEGSALLDQQRLIQLAMRRDVYSHQVDRSSTETIYLRPS